MAKPAPLAPKEYGLDPRGYLVKPGDGERTFMYDESLPSLPVPDLKQSLQRYLDSVKPFLNEKELANTESLVRRFGEGVGQRLQEKLLQRATEKRNWLDEWWLNEAYLRTRLPLAPYCNPSEAGVCQDHYLPPLAGTQLERCALHMYYTGKAWLHLRREEVEPEGRGPIKLTMNQVRNLFNAVQLPGEHIDSVQLHFKTESEGPGYSHVMVLYNGHVVFLDLLNEQGQLHTPPEIQRRLEQITVECGEAGPGLGAMTGLPRTEWYWLRKHLENLHPENKENLELMNTALTNYCLDMSTSPYTPTETFHLSVSGDVHNRWFDKCINYIVAPNGVITSNSVHSPADGMAMITINRLKQQYVYKCRGVWDGESEVKHLPRMKKLNFHYDNKIMEGVQQGKAVYDQSAANISAFVPTFYLFGKDLLKSFRFHPDTFIQLALQLSYYRMHGKPAPTYETATTRQFYRGRTETVRSCTPEALNWCQTMMDKRKTSKEKYDALKKAKDKHDWLMRECCNAQGFDRHLMGLRLIAAENGIPEPEIYHDPAWKRSGGDGNFVLSTSLSGYSLAMGGVCPMVEHGYGVFYRIHDAKITLIMTSFNSCAETNVRDLFGHIQTSFLQMRDLIAQNQPPYAKL